MEQHFCTTLQKNYGTIVPNLKVGNSRTYTSSAMSKKLIGVKKLLTKVAKL